MVFLKKTVFFLLMPLYVPLALLINSTYGWWETKGKKNSFIFYILAPLYAPAAWFLWWSFDWWVKLSE
jgi:hypothetical protein